ncbi:hypothetical protein KCP78_21150 [Salmonella enterica subsp. enterica]|nr:hypothetical protein KCP78_21150 [Salmonella enterica subsp. enterica]
MAPRLSNFILQLPHARKRARQTDDGRASSLLPDARQFMAGVLPAALRAVAAQRVLTDSIPTDKSVLSSDRALRFI